MQLNKNAKTLREYFGDENYDKLNSSTTQKAKQDVKTLFAEHDNTSLKYTPGNSDYFKSLVNQHFGK
jgi:hypothetical protein